MLTSGHARWYDVLRSTALHPESALRAGLAEAKLWGSSVSEAAKVMIKIDPLLESLPPIDSTISALDRAKMIVRTESARIDNAVAVGLAETSGMTRFVNIGLPDERQSDECWQADLAKPMTIAEWNSKTLPAAVRHEPWRKRVKSHLVPEQVGHVSPRHPNCRCYMQGVPEPAEKIKSPKETGAIDYAYIKREFGIDRSGVDSLIASLSGA
jgi:hypothetical protein